MNIDYAAIHAAARRERTDAINRLIFAPILAFFRKPQKTELRTELQVASCHS
jgi:hypothetical protein